MVFTHGPVSLTFHFSNFHKYRATLKLIHIRLAMRGKRGKLEKDVKINCSDFDLEEAAALS